MSRPNVKALIQCAMPLEATPFLKQLGEPIRVEKIGNQEFHFFDDYVIAITGIGLSNGSAGTARALMLCEPDIVIAAGTTGGLHINIEVGDIAVATNTIYSMADATAFGYEPGQLPGMPVDYSPEARAVDKLRGLDLGHPAKFGRVVSADSFVTADNVEPIRARFPDAIATDMETTGMAQVCFTTNTPWISLRAVSDLCGPKAGQDFHMDASLAASHSCDAVWAFLES
ncbi:5'-methylthioadenosine/S-adenosylhomocysteine nucleosidase [Staphylococcus chromogenes]|nr:5'-methylthioadenosine/S-adenosylhomocysteine nucleosidase [Staphylococcus chromogenes]